MAETNETDERLALIESRLAQLEEMTQLDHTRLHGNVVRDDADEELFLYLLTIAWMIVVTMFLCCWFL